MAENIAEYILKLSYDSSGAMQFEQSNKEIEAQLKSTGRLAKDSSIEYTNFSQKMKMVGKEGEKVAKVFNVMNIGIRKSNGDLEKQSVVMDDVTGATNSTATSISSMNKQTLTLGQTMKKIALRAAQTVPVWLAIRTAMQKTKQAIGFVVKNFLELEEGMRKAMAVATFTERTQSKVYANLEKRAKEYFVTSSKGFKEITEAMYQLGTAGRSTQEILEGFEHILNLSVGTFGNVAQTGKIVSGILNVYEKQLIKVGSTSSQIQYITDLLADAWKNNQIEMSEMSTAMSYLGSVGGALNIDLKDLIAASSVMSDAMLRGGKGGRLLATALVKVSKESDKLKNLGIIFDPRKPLDFKDIMGQIHDLYLEQGSSLGFVKDLTEVFGIRGGRAVLNLVQQWERFNKEIGRTPEQIKGTAEELKKSAEQTYPKLLKKLFKDLTTSEGEIGTGKPGFFKQMLIDIVEGKEDAAKRINELRKVFKTFGASLISTEKDAQKLRHALDLLGEDTLAESIVGTFGSASLKVPSRFEFEDRGFKDISKDLLATASELERLGLADEFIKVKEAQKDINENAKDHSKILSTGEALLQDWVKSKRDISDISEEELTLAKDSLGFQNISAKMWRETIKLRLKGAAEESKATDGLLNKEKMMLDQLNRSLALSMMKINGIKEEEILRKRIIDFIRDEAVITDELTGKVKRITDLTEEQQSEYLDINKILSQNISELTKIGLTDKKILEIQKLINKLKLEELKQSRGLTKAEKERLDIDTRISLVKASGKLDTVEQLRLEYELIKASEHLYTGAQKTIALRKLETQMIAENLKRVNEFSDKLKESYTQGMSDFIMGDIDFGGFQDKLQDTISRAYSDAFSQAATEKIFDFTGLGDAFGEMGVKIEDAFKTPEQRLRDVADYQAKVVEEAIKIGADYHVSVIQGGTGAPGTEGDKGDSPLAALLGLTSGGAGIKGILGGAGVKDIFGGAGKELVGPTKEALSKMTGVGPTKAAAAMLGKKGGLFDTLKSKFTGVTKGLSGFLKESRDLSKFGLGTGSLTSRATGAMSLANLYKLKGTGNVMGGAMQGAMAGAQLGGPVGMILGGLYGAFRGGQSKTTEEISKQTLQVASRIDITNKKMDLVNRNLVAMRKELTFIMPQSAYFSSKAGPDDEFSVSRRR